MREEDITKLIKKDKWMMSVLKEAEKLDLPNWMIGAGFVRSKVWNHLHGIKGCDATDIDLIYFDTTQKSLGVDKEKSIQLTKKTGFDWEVINQSYTHEWHEKTGVYERIEEAISDWPETATCIAITLVDGEPKLIAPLGIDDLVTLVVRPNFDRNETREITLETVSNRVKNKKWLQKWPKLTVVLD